MEGRSSGVLSSPCSGAGVAPGGGPRQWSFSLRALCHPWLVAVVASRAMVSNLTISPHHLTSVHALAPSPLLRPSRLHRWGTVSLSHSPARLAPAAAVAPPDCKSSLVYQICVLGQENRPLHTASGRALPTRAKRKPDVDFQSIGNLAESVSRNSQGSPSHSRTARHPARPAEANSVKWRGRPAVPG